MKKIAALLLLICTAMPASAVTPAQAIEMANPSAVEMKIIGSCLLVPRISHYLPVAWLETSPKGNYSEITAISPSESSTGALRQSLHETNYAARVLAFTNTAWRTSTIAESYGQQVCDISDSYQGGPIEAPSSNFPCESLAQSAAKQQTNEVRYAVPLQGFMTSAYDSALDDGWLTGCRDKARVDQAVAANMRCESASLPLSLNIGGSEAKALEALSCVGRWGSLIPRQARGIGATDAAASAMAAYRAMSTAKSHLGRIPFALDTGGGKFQQTAPGVSSAFIPGTLPLPGNVANSNDRKYAWIYWRKVSCCPKPF
ncbi:hypothetical protein [Rhodoferax sp.]|uniref:hypothetical protein n=1 Tax=Rhodoferax sp. TaxID=50421 RepID=UPI002ACD8FF0|nr:hypothetical protein [Rhodoferax sp.]MDZ7920657.1 hypothetical protein [Rhodoferax sp.]